MACPRTRYPRPSRAGGASHGGGSCTCPLRINIAGSPVDRQRIKKAYTRELSWYPSGPFTPGDALKAGRADTPTPRQLTATRRSPPPALSSSHLRWLRPRRHPEQEHLPEGPDMVGQARRHGWRTGPPLPGRTAAVGGLGLGQRQAYARMGQTEIIIDMI